MIGMPYSQGVGRSFSQPGGGPPPLSPPPPPPPPPPLGSVPRRVAAPSPDKAIAAQQGAAYRLYSSYGLALLHSGIEHYNDVPRLPEARRIRLMDSWRAFAQGMRLHAEDIDDARESTVRATLSRMAAEWHTYRRGSADEVYRGDSPSIRRTYPWLDAFMRATEARTRRVTMPASGRAFDMVVRAPTVMSTAERHANPYVSRATVLWHLTLGDGHPGVSEGIYKAEREITLPMYARIAIESLHYVPPGGSYMNDRAFGRDHRYVIKGRVLPGPVAPGRRGSWPGYVKTTRDRPRGRRF